jgi:hypothetical protein
MMEDALQRLWAHLPLGIRLWRHIAMGPSDSEILEIYKVFVTYSEDLAEWVESGEIVVVL